jgi:hypothetical protein
VGGWVEPRKQGSNGLVGLETIVSELASGLAPAFYVVEYHCAAGSTTGMEMVKAVQGLFSTKWDS